MRRDPSFNPWTSPLGSRRPASAPATPARRAFLGALYAAPPTSEAHGVSPEAWTLAIDAALSADLAQAFVDRLGAPRAAAVASYARATGLDPARLASLAAPKGVGR